MDELNDGADWTTFPSASVALSRLLPGPVVPGFQKFNLVVMRVAIVNLLTAAIDSIKALTATTTSRTYHGRTKRYVVLRLGKEYTVITHITVLNKYFPPDFDPSLIPRRKQPKNSQQVVRLMAPFSMFAHPIHYKTLSDPSYTQAMQYMRRVYL